MTIAPQLQSLEQPSLEQPQALLDKLCDPNFWRELNPGLSVLELQPAEPIDLDPEELNYQLAELTHEGYFQLNAVLPEIDMFRMAIGVESLVEQDLPPVFAFVYDDYWQTFQRVSPMLTAILGEDYQHLPAFWTWFIPPSDDYAGWSPHRDRITNTLRSDGMPNVVTVWIPLTDAVPLNGCMYMLPAHLDPNYPDNLADGRVANPQDIRALAAPAGSVLGWNHAVLHWGGRSSHKADLPRISMAFEFQRQDLPPYQEPLFSAKVLPSWSQRLSLIGRQISQYQHMYQLPEEWAAIAQALQEIE